MRTISTNRLTQSTHYPVILKTYNEQFAKDGKVNGKKFFREVIQPLIPEYKYDSWTKFLRTYKTQAGLMAETAEIIRNRNLHPTSQQEQDVIVQNLVTADIATKRGIAAALNIGMDALEEISSNPQLLTPLQRS